MCRESVHSIFIVLLLGLTGSASAFQLVDDFEGGNLDIWDISAGQDAVSIGPDPTKPSNNCLVFSPETITMRTPWGLPQGQAETLFYRLMYEMEPGGTVTLIFGPSDPTGTAWANYYCIARMNSYGDPANIPDMDVSTGPSGYTDVVKANLEPMRWYDVLLDIDTASKKYDVYIDNVLVYQGATFRSAYNPASLQYIMLKTTTWSNNFNNGKVYVDNIVIGGTLTDAEQLASNPSPANEATDVSRDVVLGWTPGIFAPSANGHKVYFSETFNDVNDGVGGIAQDANSYAPGRLNFSTTYYWRVDEVNGAPDYTVHQGNVWSFTTEPVGYAIENITVTASSQAPSQASENTINGSGLDDSGLLHGKEGDDAMWLSDMAGPQPTWIEFEFDKIYKLHELWVWNSNGSLEPMVGLGFKDVTIEYSSNGTEYTTLGTTHQFARAPGAPGYAHNTTIDFGGVGAKYVRLTANSNWGGIMNQYGLSEVRFFYIPVRARKPSPDSGATDLDLDLVLSFRAGREAAQHDVYFSADQQAVIDGTAAVSTVTETSHGPLSLDLAKTYYWRVDEVNEAETPATWQGDLWNFTTRQFIVVDDFESYNNLDPDDPKSNRIFNVWMDGYEVPTNGSLVGYELPPFCERTIVHGGKQSMPFFYANTGGAAYSEAELPLSPSQDWTAGSAKLLSLWFFGDPNNTAAQMYVKVNGTKVAYDGNASNLAQAGWQAWNIDLASVGTGLQNVTKLAIGIDGNGASGKLLFDDIGLRVLAPAPVNEWRIADESDDAEENISAGGINLGSSDLELPYEHTGQGEPQIIGVRFAGILIPKGATITEAWVRFEVDETKGGTEPVNLIIEGELSPNPATFSSTVGDISSRPKTTAQVQWSVPNWTTVGDQGPDQTTPSIAPIIQEIVNQDGGAGSAIVLIFRDDPANPSLGVRCAVAGPGKDAALLHIDYQ